MKRLFLLLACLTGCATVPPAGMQITVKPDRVEECRQAGGCALMSQAEISALMHQAYALGVESASAVFDSSLDSHGCRRGDT